MIISLLDNLYEAMSGAIQQDALVKQVKIANQSYKESFENLENSGLQSLLNKWLSRGSNPGGSSSPARNDRQVAVVRPSPAKGGRHIDWNKIKAPTNPIALRAVEQYQALKQKKIERKNKELMEEAKKKQKQDRLNSQAKLQVAKKGLMLERDSMLR